MIRATRTWCYGLSIALIMLLGSCGGEDANLFFELKTPTGEDPFEGVTVMQVVIERETPNNRVAVDYFSPDDTAVALLALPMGGRVRASINGLSGSPEALGAWLATGISDWFQVKEGTTTLPICFCKLATFEAGLCICTET